MFQQLLANKHDRLRDSHLSLVWPSGGLGLVTDKTTKKIKNKPRVDYEPCSTYGCAVNKTRVDYEPRSAHGRAVKKGKMWTLHQHVTSKMLFYLKNSKMLISYQQDTTVIMRKLRDVDFA